MRWLAVWWRRLLPRPAPPDGVLLWIGQFPFRDAPRAVLRYDGIDEDGFHVWAALFDKKLETESYLVHEGYSSRRNRIALKFVPAAELAAEAKKLEQPE